MLPLEILVTFFVERLAVALVSRSSLRNGRWDIRSHPSHGMPRVPQRTSNLRITRDCPGLEYVVGYFGLLQDSRYLTIVVAPSCANLIMALVPAMGQCRPTCFRTGEPFSMPLCWTNTSWLWIARNRRAFRQRSRATRGIDPLKSHHDQAGRQA
jgi:hypothetical protein